MGKNIVLLFCVAMLTGCAASDLLSGIGDVKLGRLIPGNRAVKFDRQKFEKMADQVIDIPSGASLLSINVYKVPQVIQLNFQLEEEEVIGVKVVERDKVNVDRHLLFGREYGTTEDGSLLQVQFPLPLVYILDNHINYTLELMCLDREKGKIRKEKKSLIVNWYPQLPGNSPDAVAEYGSELSVTSELLDRLGLLSQLKEELDRTNLSRFETSYRRRVEILVP